MLKGDPDNALKDQGSDVLTSSSAKKYFGSDALNKSVLGKVLKFDGAIFHDTGLIEDVPANSHLQFDLLISNPVKSLKSE